MSATVVLLLCLVACPVGMGLMMLFMRKGHRERPDAREREVIDDRAD